MLRVTIELVPLGDESRKRTLNVLEIENVGGDGNIGDYHVRLSSENRRGTYQFATVRRFKRARGAVALVIKALIELM